MGRIRFTVFAVVCTRFIVGRGMRFEPNNVTEMTATFLAIDTKSQVKRLVASIIKTTLNCCCSHMRSSKTLFCFRNSLVCVRERGIERVKLVYVRGCCRGMGLLCACLCVSYSCTDADIFFCSLLQFTSSTIFIFPLISY